MGGCLTDEMVASFAAGEMDGRARAEVEAHLRGCDDCALLVAEYAKYFFQQAEPTAEDAAAFTPAFATAPTEPEPAGTPIGRYVLGAPIDRGGAGTVYEAWDPQLKRRVALKLLRPLARAGTPAGRDDLRVRLLQEAEAMARLAHPNVVTVHDAGVHDGRVFIVMEHVEGETLAAWLGATPARHPREILDAFVAAGRGLQAAHDAGLIHGDFKPHNVLVGRDGRARVTDFGLARAQVADAGRAVLTGGTPSFMAPEQLRGHRATPASDQFSFALALYRALYGRDPFERDARRDWATGQGAPAATTGLAGLDLPARVPATLGRALALDASARFVSMGDLLGALAAPGTRAAAERARRAWPLVATALLASAIVAIARWRAAGASCGDGVVGAGEECDDGNRSDADGCLSTCRFARCGDDHVRAGVEDCDDPRDPGCVSCRRCAGGEASFLWRDNGHCYTRHAEALTWAEAARACEARDGALVGYGTAMEATAVAQALAAHDATGSWIGLRRTRGEFGFEWTAGDPWVAVVRAWWRDSAAPGGQDCAYQVAAAPTADILMPARWPTASCAERRPYVCESPAWQTSPRTNHAFRVFARRVTWDEARRACAGRGAHLASFSDAAEQASVAPAVRIDVWLGARTDRAGTPFRRVDGAPLRFAPFGVGEPDVPEGDACVVLATDQAWHDRPCRHLNGYLCEVD